MSKRDSRGFTLIAALLLTLLLSGLAVGLLFLVTGEQRMGNNDLENNLAYYGAEAGIENLTAQLSQLYQTSQSPNAAAITALTAATNYPTTVTGSNITNMNYLETINWPPNQSNGTPCPNSPNPCGSWDIVGSGSDQGMVASLIPFTLQVTAIRAASAGEVTSNSSINPTGAAVNLTRTVEVALLPAFEFGVFCDGDCDYFAGPNFNFGGRVHANGNLFLASGSSLTFTDKIAAVGQVVTDQLENGWPTGTNYTGSVYVPSAGAACPPAPGSGPAANCNALPNGSWAGGFPPPPPPASCTSNCGGAAVPGWKGTSTVNFASFITTGLTGATKLQLPFVQADAVGAIEIIRRKQATDTPLLASSRLYSEASIRILMADTLADLHPDRGAGALDANDVQLVLPTSGGYQTLTAGIPGAGQYMYYATAKTGANGWVLPAIAGCSSPWPLLGDVTTNLPGPCGGPFLRVEYQTTAGAWVGVTQEWLSYGFGRPYNTPPTAPYNPGGPNPACSVYPTLPAGQCYNPVGPAILILQQLNQGVGVGSAYEATANDPSLTSTAYNWIPINFYDSREGEPRDNGARLTNTTNVNGTQVFTACSPNGVMNAVELDVGNLWLWLQKTGVYNSGHGPAVVNSNFNGYIVYFADHRGMIADPHPTAIGLYNGMTGMSGLEDTINSPSSTGVPDNALEPASYYAFSPEDVNADGFFDNWGEKYLAAGFGLSGALMSQPYFPIPANPPASNANQVNCNNYIRNAAGAVLFGPYTGAGSPQNNMVTGPRHVLRLVDGGMSAAAVSYLPHPPIGQTGDGFTVASEEPVYVWGDYNSGPTDPYWPSGNVTTTPHSAASIIADSVTLLSNPPSGATLPTSNTGWTDVESFEYPGQSAARPGNTSHYRMAIAAGKSVPFPEPGWAKAIPLQDFGTDGGMHNFLRYLEARGANGAQVNYTGSLISMFYSQYNTGIFKCCNVVYGAPQRNYFFDTQFLNPNNLPPGTPMFQDVVSLSYHQNFTPQ